jgi:hypothetical protein
MGDKQKLLFIPRTYNDTNDVLTDKIEELVKDLEVSKKQIKGVYKNKLNELQQTIYDHSKDDVLLQNELDKELKKHIKRETDLFKAHQLSQNNSVQRINNQVDNLLMTQRELLSKGYRYGNLTSLEGNQNMSVSSVSGTNDYLINVNNKCLHTNRQNQYKLQSCQENSVGQRFQIHPIYDDQSYYAIFNKNPSAADQQSYPYNIVQSKLSNNCLEHDKGEIYLNKCESLNGQKWAGMLGENSSKKCAS